jgi:hypothetical protein
MIENIIIIMNCKNMENVRIAKCEHTSKLVVQEKFGEEWVCMHGENDKEDVELINKVKNERV